MRIVFLMNLFVLFGTPVYILTYHLPKVPVLCLLIKILIEFLITFKGAMLYRRLDLLKYFPVWTILQIPYVILAGLLGSLGHFIWKDRKDFQEVTTFRTAP